MISLIEPSLRCGVRRLMMSFMPSSVLLNPPRLLSSSTYMIVFPSSDRPRAMSSILPSRSPRYCAPLSTMLGRSSLMVKPFSLSGVLPSRNDFARPCTKAVLPTPLPPTMRMLFLRFLQRIRMASLVSFVRPIMSAEGHSRKNLVHLSV